jgi:RHS repeat-associated protein
VAKTVDGVTTGYVLDPAAGLIQVLQETTGGQTQSYLYGHDLLAQYDSGTWAYHVNDGLGSVRGLADPTGQVVQSHSFSPFGVPLGASGGEPYGFTGEQWDASAGLVFLRARYYEPATGRFLSQDPFPGFTTSPQTLNAYQYVANNAVNHVDPSGYQRPGEMVSEWVPIDSALFLALLKAGAEVVKIVGPYALVLIPVAVLSYWGIANFHYGPAGPPAPAPPKAPPTEEPTIGEPPVGPGFSQGEAGPESPFVQPARAPEPPPAPQPQPQMDPITYEPCPRERETPEPRGQIWRAISTDPRRSPFNWRPSQWDTDGLSGTRGGTPPYHQDPVAWFQIAMRRRPDPLSDRVMATTEQTLIVSGFSVENTFDTNDRWHVSIGGASPGIVIRKGRPSWPGTKSERREIENRLASLFTIPVWP